MYFLEWCHLYLYWARERHEPRTLISSIFVIDNTDVGINESFLIEIFSNWSLISYDLLKQLKF